MKILKDSELLSLSFVYALLAKEIMTEVFGFHVDN